MTNTPKEVTLHVMFNEDGDVTADIDRDTAIDRMNDEYGGNFLREVKLTLSIPLPKPAEARIDIPEETAAATVTVAG